MNSDGYDDNAWYYDLSHADFTEDIDFYLKILGPEPLSILECGCGSGRILLPLAQAGHHCWGIDSSAAMLALARQKIASLDQAVVDRLHLSQADMRSFTLDRHFDRILIPHNTLMHLERSSLERTFRTIRHHLTPHGRLLIDLQNPYDLLTLVDQPTAQPEASWIDPRDGKEVIQSSKYWLCEDQVLCLTWQFVKEERIEGEIAAEYTIWLPHELQLTLQQAGLKLEKIRGGYDDQGFSEESDRLILEATRAD